MNAKLFHNSADMESLGHAMFRAEDTLRTTRGLLYCTKTSPHPPQLRSSLMQSSQPPFRCPTIPSGSHYHPISFGSSFSWWNPSSRRLPLVGVVRRAAAVPGQ